MGGSRVAVAAFHIDTVKQALVALDDSDVRRAAMALKSGAIS